MWCAPFAQQKRYETDPKFPHANRAFPLDNTRSLRCTSGCTRRTCASTRRPFGHALDCWTLTCAEFGARAASTAGSPLICYISRRVWTAINYDTSPSTTRHTLWRHQYPCKLLATAYRTKNLLPVSVNRRGQTLQNDVQVISISFQDLINN